METSAIAGWSDLFVAVAGAASALAALILAGLSVCGLLSGGIAWFAAGAIACMLVAMFNAWILLVEINR
jgi:hypothetical protein